MIHYVFVYLETTQNDVRQETIFFRNLHTPHSNNVQNCGCQLYFETYLSNQYMLF